MDITIEIDIDKGRKNGRQKGRKHHPKIELLTNCSVPGGQICKNADQHVTTYWGGGGGFLRRMTSTNCHEIQITLLKSN